MLWAQQSGWICLFYSVTSLSHWHKIYSLEKYCGLIGCVAAGTTIIVTHGLSPPVNVANGHLFLLVASIPPMIILSHFSSYFFKFSTPSLLCE